MASPYPVTNAEFTRALAKVVKRPAILPVPAFALRLVLGELADEALLASTRVEPRKLTDGGFQFKFPDLESALESLL
jgi:NAD dependent epimerase/dehydratase family enzyme